MGVLFSRFRSKPTTKELLEEIQKEITALEEYKRSTELQQKAVVRSLIFYSVFLYIIVAAVFLFYSYPLTTKDAIIYAIPFLIFPLLLYILKRFLHWYFLQKLKHNEDNLADLRKRKKSMIEFAMETETFKVVKELLEKYDPQYHKKIFEPKPAIEAPPLPGLRGSFNDMDLRRRNIGPRGSPPRPMGSSLVMTGAPVRPPAPPMPRPLLPRERTIMDRFVDYLVGDGPSNRYALICRQCKSHNGMALKEEFEYIGFRCCYCFQFNPPRNHQPPPPRLTLPAPSAPAITEGTSSAASSSDEAEPSEIIEPSTDGEADIETNTPLISPQESGSILEEEKENESILEEEQKEKSPNSRLSVSSSASEIQANLVEDFPFADSDDTSTCEVLNSSEKS